MTERVVAVHETFFLAPGPNVCLAPSPHPPFVRASAFARLAVSPHSPGRAAFCARFSVPISFARRFYPNQAANNTAKRSLYGSFTRRDLTKRAHKPLFGSYVLGQNFKIRFDDVAGTLLTSARRQTQKDQVFFQKFYRIPTAVYKRSASNSALFSRTVVIFNYL